MDGTEYNARRAIERLASGLLNKGIDEYSRNLRKNVVDEGQRCYNELAIKRGFNKEQSMEEKLLKNLLDFARKELT
jgi:hypothetical protein